MKLKKIASLLLAGVMAASMLAGCNTANIDEPQDDPTGDTGETASISKDVADLIKNVPEYVTFEDSDKLDSDLAYAVEFAGVMDVMPQYLGYDSFTDQGYIFGTHEGAVAADVVARLRGRVTNKYDDTITFRNIGSNDKLWLAENGSSTTPEVTTVALRAVSTAIGETALKTMTAEMLEKYVTKYQYSIDKDENGDTTGGNYNYNYTVSVSTYTKEVKSSFVGGSTTGGWIQGGAENPSVTFVAIQVVRTATHQ